MGGAARGCDDVAAQRAVLEPSRVGSERGLSEPTPGAPHGSFRRRAAAAGRAAAATLLGSGRGPRVVAAGRCRSRRRPPRR